MPVACNACSNNTGERLELEDPRLGGKVEKIRCAVPSIGWTAPRGQCPRQNTEPYPQVDPGSSPGPALGGGP